MFFPGGQLKPPHEILRFVYFKKWKESRPVVKISLTEVFRKKDRMASKMVSKKKIRDFWRENGRNY
jgi:hypothetical protein